jgi:hypothetical protein
MNVIQEGTIADIRVIGREALQLDEIIPLTSIDTSVTNNKNDILLTMDASSGEIIGCEIVYFQEKKRRLAETDSSREDEINKDYSMDGKQPKSK